MLINIKTCHLHSSINHQEHLFHKTLHHFSYFHPMNIAKFWEQLFYRTTPEAVVFIVLESLFKRLAGWRPATLLKSLQHRCFPVKFAKILRTLFTGLVWRLLLNLQWLLLYFFKKVIKQLLLFWNLVMTY